MGLFELSFVVALVVFALMLGRGRGLWNALGAAVVVVLAGFALDAVLLLLSVMVAGTAIAALFASILLAPLLLLLAPLFLIIGIAWLAGYARRNPL